MLVDILKILDLIETRIALRNGDDLVITLTAVHDAHHGDRTSFHEYPRNER